jgi:hypothetical protein
MTTAAAATRPVAQASGMTKGQAPEAFEGITDPRLTALVHRLDGALVGDGQLL